MSLAEEWRKTTAVFRLPVPFGVALFALFTGMFMGVWIAAMALADLEGHSLSLASHARLLAPPILLTVAFAAWARKQPKPGGV